MLVKFDHLTYVVNRNNVDDTIRKFINAGYSLTLIEDNAINSPEKMRFLQFKDKTHGLYFLSAPEKNGIPIELIAYEHTTHNNICIDYIPGDNSLTLKTSNTNISKKLFETIGCEIEYNKATFNGVLDPRPYDIHFETMADLAVNLDNEGYCCPTFFVRPADKTRKAIMNAGFFVSELEFFTVQNKSMYVFFAKDDAGTLIEFVSNKI